MQLNPEDVVCCICGRQSDNILNITITTGEENRVSGILFICNTCMLSGDHDDKLVIPIPKLEPEKN